MPDLDAFLAHDLRVGTVRSARLHEAARVPAFILDIDFGPLGTRTSSAQLTRHYTPETLTGRQVIAIVSLPPRRVAGVVSEVLVLAAVDDDAGTILLQPERAVPDGARIA